MALQRPKTKRKAVSAGLRRMLMMEAGWKCAVLRCEHETGLDIHHIDGDRTNNDEANLIVLCAVHHRRATSREIDATACRALKALLQIDRLGPGFIELPAKSDVNAALCREIERTSSFRAILCGPFFLHPQWLFERRRMDIQHEDFDLKLKQFLGTGPSLAAHDVRIMLTNSPRYEEKVRGLLEPTELSSFKSEMAEAMEALWGGSLDRSPDLCCVHPGFGHIVYIFDDVLITQFRAAQLGPTRGGLSWRSPSRIQHERTWFDTIFEEASRGQVTELARLRDFVGSIRFN